MEHEIAEPDDGVPPSASKVNASTPFAPDQLIWLFNDVQWEDFVKEWAHCKKKTYHLVCRMGGANDFGVDVACFKSDKGFQGDWDSFQCKFYEKALMHIFSGQISKPNNYYFFAPKDCGPSLKKLLLDSSKLKKYVLDNWESQCQKTITMKQEVLLTDSFLEFFEAFDFSLFQYKPTHEVIEDHKTTPYHIQRFGGGLGERPKSSEPPVIPLKSESRYIEQLVEAYTDTKEDLSAHANAQDHPSFKDHFNRSRESFFEAESLHKFARDSVPNGTFEKLQDEVYFGVKDTEEEDHGDAFKRVKEVTKTARSLNVQSSGLHGVVGLKDLQGICHQLANVDRLTWKKS